MLATSGSGRRMPFLSSRLCASPLSCAYAHLRKNLLLHPRRPGRDSRAAPSLWRCQREQLRHGDLADFPPVDLERHGVRLSQDLGSRVTPPPPRLGAWPFVDFEAAPRNVDDPVDRDAAAAIDAG